MDFWTSLAFNAVLQILANRQEVGKWYGVLAKVYAKIEGLARVDPRLRSAVEDQLRKEGLT
jgi:hypothetical protein